MRWQSKRINSCFEAAQACEWCADQCADPR